MKLKEIFAVKNVGTTDKRIRLAIGSVLFAGGVMVSHIPMGIIGLMVFFTGLRENCPIYTLCKHNTIEK